MHIRLLFATADEATRALLHSLLDSAIQLSCPPVVRMEVATRSALLERAKASLDDVILLDWALADAGTPDLVRELLGQDPQLRTVVLLPQDMRQYREQVWNAGACNSIPKEHMDQEWLASILCVMFRAMQREARLRASFAALAQPAD